MNPEFLRNLWLEATPLRLALIAGLLLLAFTASNAMSAGPQNVALALYWFFVVLWGTRAAALSVVGEIRERTWDGQKLSAIGPVEMVWGKLFGSTIHTWFAGLLCLGAILPLTFREQGTGVTLRFGVVLLLVGVLAQAVALLSSLMLIRRDTGNWRLDTFLCQVAGILAAAAYYALVHSFGASATPRGVTWWEHSFDYNDFQTVSLILAAGWALVGCVRSMRAELRFANGPFVWLAWLLYLFVYQAGFSSLLPQHFFDSSSLAISQAHLLLGAAALMVSTYGMAFVERKDPVQLRWLCGQLRVGRIWRVFLALDAWMLSYVATLVVGAVLAVLLASIHALLAEAVFAMLGFMTRDVAIFVLMRGFSSGKGDFAALAVLAALYILMPMIAGYQEPLASLLLPMPGNLLSVIAAWAQGLALAFWALTTLRLSSPQ
jgi:hypothetical protein